MSDAYNKLQRIHDYLIAQYAAAPADSASQILWAAGIISSVKSLEAMCCVPKQECN